MKIHQPALVEEPDYPVTITAAATALGLTRQEAATLILSHRIPARAAGRAKYLDRPGFLKLARVAGPVLASRSRRELATA